MGLRDEALNPSLTQPEEDPFGLQVGDVVEADLPPVPGEEGPGIPPAPGSGRQSILDEVATERAAGTGVVTGEAFGLGVPEPLPTPEEAREQLGRGAVFGMAEAIDFIMPSGTLKAVSESFDDDIQIPEAALRPTAAMAGDVFDKLGIPRPTDTGVLEKIGEASAGAGPKGILTLGRMVARGLKVPLRTALSEVLSILGEAFGREEFEGGLSEAAGGVTGSIGGAVTPGVVSGSGGLVKRAGKGLARVVRGGLTEKDALKQAGQIVRGGTSDVQRALRKLDEFEELRAGGDSGAPGLDLGETGPSAAAITGDPFLRDLEADAFRTRSRGGPTSLDMELARSEGNVELRRELISMRPSVNSTDEASSGVKSWLDGRIDAIVRQSQEAQGSMPPEEASKIARVEFKRLAGEWQTKGKGLLDDVEVEAASVGAVVPTDPIIEAYRDMTSKVGQAEKLKIDTDLNEMFKRFLNTEPGQRVIPFDFLRSLERRVSDDLSAAYDAGDKGKIRQLAILRDGVDAALDNLGAAGHPNPTPAMQRATAQMIRRGQKLHPQLAEQHRIAKTYWATGAARFRDGVGGDLSARVAKNAAAEERTLDLFFGAGTPGAAKAAEFKRVFKDSPTALNAMNDYIVGRALTGLVDETGFVNKSAANANRLRGFKASHEAALRAFPEARERIKTLETLTRNAEESGLLGKPRSQAAIERGALRLFVDNPQDAIRDIMRLSPEKSARSMAELQNKIRGTQAQAGFQRAVMDEIESAVLRADPGVTNYADVRVDPAKLSTMLEKHRSMLDRVFPPGHVDRLDRVLEMSKVLDKQLTATSERILKDPKGVMESIAGSSIFNQLLSPRARVLRIGKLVNHMANAMGANDINTLIRRASRNPALMRALLTVPTAENEAKLVRFISASLPTLASRIEFPAREFEQENKRRGRGQVGTGNR